MFLLLFIKNNLKHEFLWWRAEVLNGLPKACLELADILIQSPQCCCCFCNQMPAFKQGGSNHPGPVVPLGHNQVTLCRSRPPQTQPHPFLVSPQRGARAVVIYSVLTLLFFLEEKYFSVSVSLSWVKKKDHKVSIRLFIYFISFLDPQAAELHFHLKWKGSDLLSDLEKRDHAHSHRECFVCLFNLLISNLYLFNSKYFWSTQGRGTQGTNRTRCEPWPPHAPEFLLTFQNSE